MRNDKSMSVWKKTMDDERCRKFMLFRNDSLSVIRMIIFLIFGALTIYLYWNSHAYAESFFFKKPSLWNVLGETVTVNAETDIGISLEWMEDADVCFLNLYLNSGDSAEWIWGDEAWSEKGKVEYSLTIPGNMLIYGEYSLAFSYWSNFGTGYSKEIGKRSVTIFAVNADGIKSDNDIEAENVVQVESAEADFEYTIIGGEAVITAYEGSARYVRIPETLGGAPVTVVGEYAFGWSNVKKVTFPDTMRELKHGAFNSCVNLKNVEINEGLLTIGTNAFFACYSLEALQIPETVKTIGAYAIGYTQINSANNKDESVIKQLLDYDTRSDFWGEERLACFARITGAKGSAAEKYAYENRIAFEEEDTYMLQRKSVKGSIKVENDIDLLVNYSATLRPLAVPDKTFRNFWSMTDNDLSRDQSDFIFTSSDPSVAMVDLSGTITGVGEGTAMITVTDRKGMFEDAKCVVTVQDRAPVYLALLMAVSEFETAINDVDGSFVATANRFRQLLERTQYAGNIYTLYNFSRAEAFTQFEELKQWNGQYRLTKYDVTFVYLATHGQRLGFFGREGGTGFVTADGAVITYRELREGLDQINSHVILFVDSCYSGMLLENDVKYSFVNAILNVFISENDELQTVVFPGNFNNGKYSVMTSCEWNDEGSALPDRTYFGSLLLMDFQKYYEQSMAELPDYITAENDNIYTLSELYDHIQTNIPYLERLRLDLTGKAERVEDEVQVWPENSQIPVFIFPENEINEIARWMLQPRFVFDDIQPVDNCEGFVFSVSNAQNQPFSAVYEDGKVGLIDYDGQICVAAKHDAVVYDEYEDEYVLCNKRKYRENYSDHAYWRFNGIGLYSSGAPELWDGAYDEFVCINEELYYVYAGEVFPYVYSDDGEPDPYAHVIRSELIHDPEYGMIPCGGYGLYFADRICLEPIYTNARFSGNDNHAVYSFEMDGKWGYYDKNGKEIIPPISNPVWNTSDRYLGEKNLYLPYDVSEEFIAVHTDEGAGFYDVYGNIAVPLMFDEVRPVNNGKAWVKHNGYWGVIRVGASAPIEDSSAELNADLFTYLDTNLHDLVELLGDMHDDHSTDSEQYSNEVICLSSSWWNPGFITFIEINAISDYNICGVYVGQKLEQAHEILCSDGWSRKRNAAIKEYEDTEGNQISIWVNGSTISAISVFLNDE